MTDEIKYEVFSRGLDDRGLIIIKKTVGDKAFFIVTKCLFSFAEGEGLSK